MTRGRERAGPQLRLGAAEALAAAFQLDPMMVHLAPDADRRRRMLPRYFQAVFRQAGRAGRLRVSDDTGIAPMDRRDPQLTGVAGAAVAMPPGSYPLPLLPQLAEWPTMVASGWGATFRNFRDLPPIDAARPRERYWYLMYLGVHPDRQGQGHEAALLGDVLADADRDRLPTYLVTMNEANLGWYGRFGFAVREELRLGRRGPPAWSMLRPA